MLVSIFKALKVNYGMSYMIITFKQTIVPSWVWFQIEYLLHSFHKLIFAHPIFNFSAANLIVAHTADAASTENIMVRLLIITC